MKWSGEQLQAIELRDKNLLVAAAAGSGKTAVLVERIIRRVMDEQRPVDVDKLLVVTFTNAAAAEMRERVGGALAQALKIRPDAPQLERQLVLLNAASICTIHAFCQNIVRQNFHLLDLDPNFRVAGEPEMNLLKADVLENLFEEQYAAGEPEFMHFIAHYGDGHHDQALYELVLNLYNFSRSQPWPEAWLNNLAQHFAIPAGADIEDTPWPALLRDKIALELEQAGQLLDKLTREAMLPGNPSAYAEVFQSDRLQVGELIAAAACSWEQLSQALQDCTFAKLPSIKGTDETVKKYFQKNRQTVKTKISEFRQLYFDRLPEELLEDLRLTAPAVKGLGHLVNSFAVRFSKAKAAKSLVDFNDLEHFCLKILLDEQALPGEVRPSPVAVACQQKYAEIMVDEYQDTNGVQETILSLLTKPDQPNLFLVGDVKQSIYRFRLAEPELFLAKYRQYPLCGETCARVDLTRNFRSRPGVLQAINFLFGQLMTPRVAELEYGPAERLNPGPDYPESSGRTLDGPVEVWLIDRDSQDDSEVQDEEAPAGEAEAAGPESEGLEPAGFELEARLTAERINALMAGNYVVYDKELRQYRPLAWRDMVILLRSVKNKANILLEVLRQTNIPAYAEIDSGYFREIEVQVMLSLLSIIDNPRQDIQLAGVLRSPVVRLSAEELAELRLAQADGSLWDALSAYAGDGQGVLLQRKLAEFIAQLAEWRSFSRRKGVPELIWKLYRDTGYYHYVGSMPGGMLRQANLRALYDRARQYETTNFRGLFRFLRFVERLQNKGTDLAIARALGESEDVVRVMSIHKSKGLEFPVVFLADIGKNINFADGKALVLKHKKLGIGPYVINPELRFRYPTLARQGIAYKLSLETRAEELRILYVALTRAREKLILIGSASRLEQKATVWCQTAGNQRQSLPDALIAGAKSYLDWLLPAIARHADGQVLRDCTPGCDQPVEPLAADASRWQIRICPASQLDGSIEQKPADAELLNRVKALEPVDAAGLGPEVERLLNWRYSCPQAVGKPAKLSVSEIKRRFELLDPESSQKLHEQQPLSVRPRFLQDSGKLTGAEYGTLMHTVMQHIQLDGDLSAAGLQGQLQAMAERELLPASQAAAVDLSAIRKFFEDGLGRRIRQSARVRRELPFSLMLPAGRIYPDLEGTAETIFVQGIIDVLFDEPDGLVLVDYKTDNIRAGSQLAEKYAVQLNLYAEAVETIFRQPVKEKYLYSFCTNEVIKL